MEFICAQMVLSPPGQLEGESLPSHEQCWPKSTERQASACVPSLQMFAVSAALAARQVGPPQVTGCPEQAEQAPTQELLPAQNFMLQPLPLQMGAEAPQCDGLACEQQPLILLQSLASPEESHRHWPPWHESPAPQQTPPHCGRPSPHVLMG